MTLCGSYARGDIPRNGIHVANINMAASSHADLPAPARVNAGRMDRADVDFAGHEKRIWRVGVLAEDGLAADDHEFALAGDFGRGADDVLELLALHPTSFRFSPGSMSGDVGHGFPVRCPYSAPMRSKSNP